MIDGEEIRVDVNLTFILDVDDVPPEHLDGEGLYDIVEEVINAGIYDIPGGRIDELKIKIEGVD